MTKIEIATNPRFSWRRTTLGTAIQTAPIGLGIWTGSTAMQWIGFVFALLFIIELASIFLAQNRGLTISQARARLDEIEMEQAK